MLGFTPGFPYLGGLSKELETPRKETPRLQISPGSVGIGGNQTGIYPLETPGGWNIIGRTPISLFNPEEEIPTYIQSGMYLRFIPITKEEYVSLEGAKNGCRGFACGNVYNSPRFRAISLSTIRCASWRGDGSKCTSGDQYVSW